MIDSMFQAGVDRTLDDQIQRPRVAPPQTPGTFAGFGTALPRGVGAAAAEGIAFGAEVTGAFGDVLAAYPETMGPVQLDETQRKESEAARRKLLDKGMDFSNEAGDIFRARAKEIMPDPNTTGTATQVLAGVSKFGAKAVGYTLTAGPFSAFAIGADEGMTEADRLKQEGVDIKTRTKAGAVAGGIAGVSMVIPMTGSTAVTRFAKGAGSGIVGVVGQSAAEKAIIKAAGYDKIADTFDPLDPVALALGVVPGALGAKFGHAVPKPAAAGAVRPLAEMGIGERQALRYDDTRLDAYAVQAAQRAGIPPEVLLAVKNAGEKSGPKAASPKGAQGVMQFMPETYREVGRGDPLDPINSIDAGAKYLKKLHDAYGDWDAAVAHYNGGGSQAALVRSGGRPSFKETAAYLDRVKAYMGKVEDEQVAATVRANPELVDAARVNLNAAAIDAARLTSDMDIAGRDAHVAALETASAQLGRGEPVDVGSILGDRPLDVDRVNAMRDQFQDTTHLRPAADDVHIAKLDQVSQSTMHDMYAAAAREKPGFDAAMTRIAGEIGGTAKLANIKGTERAVAKVTSDYGGDPSKIKDLVRGTIEVESAEAAQRAVASLFEHFDVLPTGRRNLLDPTKSTVDGYRDAKFNVRINGHVAEVQVNIPEMLAAKKKVHHLYAEREAIQREIKDTPLEAVDPAKLSRIGELNAGMREAYDAAWAEATSARNSDSSIGAPLRRADSGSNERGGLASQATEYGRAGTAASETGMPSTSKNSALGENLAGSASETGSRFMGTSDESLHLEAMSREALQVATENPGMLIQVDGIDAPVRAADLLEAVRKDAAGEVADSKLLEIAAQCALRS